MRLIRAKMNFRAYVPSEDWSAPKAAQSPKSLQSCFCIDKDPGMLWSDCAVLEADVNPR